MFLEELLKFLTNYTFVVQFVVVAFSIAFILSPPVREGKSLAIFFGKTVVLFIAELLVNTVFIVLAKILPRLNGIGFFISHLLVLSVYCIFFCKFGLYQRLIMSSVLYCTIITVTELGARFVELVSSGHVPGHMSPWTLVSYLLILLCVFFLYRYSIKQIEDISISFVGMIEVPVFAAAFLIYFHTASMGPGNPSSEDRFYVAVLVAIYVIVLENYFLWRSACNERMQQTILQKENEFLMASNSMMKLSEQSIIDMRELRHDIKNQLTTMSILLENGKYDKLKEYFSNLAVTVSDKLSYIDCGNKEVSAILNMEMQKCKVNRIVLDCKVNVPPQLPFAPNDICSLLTNIIDNAMEACVRRESTQRPILFEMAVKQDYLVVCCRNFLGEMNEEERGETLLLRSRKGDGNNHGLGHKIVEKTVKKYNGAVNYDIRKNEFIAQLMLDMKWGGGIKWSLKLQCAMMNGLRWRQYVPKSQRRLSSAG